MLPADAGTATPGVRERPADVDCDWMNAALRDAGILDDACVAGLTFAPVGHGMMSDCFRFTLSYAEASARGPETVVGKFAAADPTSRETGVSLLIYMSEVRFYQHLAPRIRARAPQAFLADMDEESGAFTLLMEDLQPARSIDQIDGCSIGDCQAAIRALAGVHAPFWRDPAVGELDVLRLRKANFPMLAKRVTAAAEGFLDRYGDRIDNRSRRVIERYAPYYLRLLADTAMPATLRHADFRLDNLLFDIGDPGEVAILDWGGINTGSGLMDLSTFIGQSLSAGQRQSWEERLVHDYHARLQELGVADYGWDDCWADYRRSAFAGLSLSVSSAMWVERSERADRLFLDMARKTTHQIDDISSFAAWD